jgi:hypothetical protein
MNANDAEDVRAIVRAALSGSARQIEAAIAEVIRRFRAAEVEPLRRRLEALEQRSAYESRLGAVERRLADAGNVEPLDLKLLRGGRS